MHAAWFTEQFTCTDRTFYSCLCYGSAEGFLAQLRYYTNSIGYPSESVSSSEWLAWFASHCPGRRLSAWQMIAASCPTALSALCGQLTFQLAWCREHSAVTATELLQPLDLACGTLFQFSCAVHTSHTNCSNDSWRDTFFGKHVTSNMQHLRKTPTYLLNYKTYTGQWDCSIVLEIFQVATAKDKHLIA